MGASQGRIYFNRDNIFLGRMVADASICVADGVEIFYNDSFMPELTATKIYFKEVR